MNLSKSKDIKLIYKNQLYFYKLSAKILENKIKSTIPFITAPKKGHLATSLTQYLQDLYTEN